ncbi:hypothetical protein MRX96_027997 [Rhipicephalus microplus]
MNTSPAKASTAQQLREKQAVSAIGSWLQQHAEGANLTAPDHVAPVFSTTASSDNTSGVLALNTTEDKDTTVVSREKARKQNEELTAAPNTSCLARDIAATSQALAKPLQTDHSSKGSVETLPKAPTAGVTALAPRKRSSQRKQYCTSETHPADDFAASVPQSPSFSVPRLCPSSSHAEGVFITVVSKAAQQRARAMQASAIVTDPAVVGTALYSPSSPGGSLGISSPHARGGAF